MAKYKQEKVLKMMFCLLGMKLQVKVLEILL